MMKNYSIRKKLLFIILGNTVLTLLAGFATVIGYDYWHLKGETLEQARLMARVVAGYVAAELVFSDDEAAIQTLGLLRPIPDLESASLYDAEGSHFASFPSSLSSPKPLPSPNPSANAEFKGGNLYVVQPIFDQEGRVGTLQLCATTTTLWAETWRHVRMLVLIMLLLIALASLAALRLQGVISKPILHLADAARSVSVYGDYGTRVTRIGDDEVATLYTAWNEMLGQIEHRQQEQARTETALRRSEEQFRSMIEQSRDAIYVIRDSDPFVYVNPKFEELLEYSLEEVTAPDFSVQTLVAPTSRAFVQTEKAKRARNERSLSKFEFQCISRSGRSFDFEVHATEIEWDETPARMGILHDITDRKRVELQLRSQRRQLQEDAEQLQRYADELERSNRELDQFAYVVSHDLKAPLRAIGNLSTWIEEDLASVISGETRTQMNLLRGRVGRMENLINGILEYSRVGRVHTKVREFDVGLLIHETVEDLGPSDQFEIEIAENMPTLVAERIRLGQVFSNLIGNSIKHHPRQAGRVEVGVAELNGTYQFWVSDDGAGIAPDYQEKIFVMFQTLQPRDRHESTGVGLAIAKKIVEDQGGQMRVESNEGSGATFRFTWPKRPPGEPGQPRSGQGRTKENE